MRALLLGGAGFIGLHLARRLVAEGHEITIVDDFSRGREDRDLGGITRGCLDRGRPRVFPVLHRRLDGM